jgi:hypothetical protein
VSKKKTPTELAKVANHHHAAVLQCVRSALQHAKQAGDALRAAKKQVGHGCWTAWLADKFTASPETARAYMRVSQRWGELEPLLQDGRLTLQQALEWLRVKRARTVDDAAPTWMSQEDLFIRQVAERDQRQLRVAILRIIKHLDKDLVFYFSYLFCRPLYDFCRRLVDDAGPIPAAFARPYLRWEYYSRKLDELELPEDARERREQELHEEYAREVGDALRPLLDDPQLTAAQREQVEKLLEEAAPPKPSTEEREEKERARQQRRGTRNGAPIFYFSGEENRATPEAVLGDAANVMFSFAWMYRNGNAKPNARFQAILDARAGKRPAGQ